MFSKRRVNNDTSTLVDHFVSSSKKERKGIQMEELVGKRKERKVNDGPVAIPPPKITRICKIVKQ